MLSLTRKVGQRIKIGDDIEIVIREVRGRQVRLGIRAPAALKIIRDELERTDPCVDTLDVLDLDSVER